MTREAKLFESVKGSPVRALRRLNANIPPNWILRARKARKRHEPGIVDAMKNLKRLRTRRPRARATIRAAERELTQRLKAWEVAYQKEVFYNGLRALLEISRTGKSRR